MKKKVSTSFGFAILAVVGVFLLIYLFTQKQEMESELQYTIGNDITTSTAPSFDQEIKTKKSGGTSSAGAPKMSYTDAVNAYANRRIQFDSNCIANPTSLVINNNTGLMLDNRSGQTKTIFVDDVPYAIGAFDYKVVTPKKPVLPYTMRIDCGSGKNNAQVILQ